MAEPPDAFDDEELIWDDSDLDGRLLPRLPKLRLPKLRLPEFRLRLPKFGIGNNFLVFFGIAVVIGIISYLLFLEDFSGNVDEIYLILLSLIIGIQASVILWPLIQNFSSLSHSTIFWWDSDAWRLLVSISTVLQALFGYIVIFDNPGFGDLIFFPSNEPAMEFLAHITSFNICCSLLILISALDDLLEGVQKEKFVPIVHNSFVPASFLALVIMLDLLLNSHVNAFFSLTAFMLMFVGMIGWMYSQRQFGVSRIPTILVGIAIFVASFAFTFPVEIFEQDILTSSIYDRFEWLPSADSGYNNLAIGLMAIILITTLIGTNLNVDRTDFRDSQTTLSKWNSLILLLIFCFISFTLLVFSETMLLFGLNLAFIVPLSLAILNSSQFRKLNGTRYHIHRILNPDSDVVDNKSLDFDIAIIGDPKSGKTSYLASLYTLLTNRRVRDIWWGVDEVDVKKDPFASELKNLKALAKRGDADVVQMIEDRISATTCKGLENRFPENNAAGFPIRAEAFSTSEVALNNFMERFTNKDPEKRLVQDPTIKNNEDLRFNLNFVGEVDELTPRFVSNLKRSRKRTSRRLELTVNSPDIAGESFSLAIQSLRSKINENKNISKIELLSFEVDHRLVNELTNGQFNGSIDSINWVIGKILKCPNLILVADIKNMSSGEQDSTESFLSLLAKLHSRNFSNITSLTILLNKADDVLGDKDESDLIENWSDMNDSLLATELLNRFTNSALSELKSTGLNCNVSFCCSLGGMFESDRPMYPLVPVNVLEPLIDLILDASVAES